MRTFFAFDLPADMTAELTKTLIQCRKICPQGIKWTDNNNLHVTLVFIGDVSKEQAEKISGDVEHHFGGLKSFPAYKPRLELFPAREPRLVWVECDFDAPAVEQTIKEIRKYLQKENIFIDSKPFKLHITLGRIKKKIPENLLTEIINSGITDGSWQIKEVSLYESRLRPEGPQYIRLKKYSLQED